MRTLLIILVVICGVLLLVFSSKISNTPFIISIFSASVGMVISAVVFSVLLMNRMRG